MPTMKLELGPRKRSAHGVRDKRSPMQAPVGRVALGDAPHLDFAPVRAQLIQLASFSSTNSAHKQKIATNFMA